MLVLLVIVTAIVLVAALACVFVLYRRAKQHFHETQSLVRKQAKGAVREAERTRRAAERALARTERVFEDARLLHERVDGLLADPGLKHVLSTRRDP